MKRRIIGLLDDKHIWSTAWFNWDQSAARRALCYVRGKGVPFLKYRIQKRSETKWDYRKNTRR